MRDWMGNAAAAVFGVVVGLLVASVTMPTTAPPVTVQPVLCRCACTMLAVAPEPPYHGVY